MGIDFSTVTETTGVPVTREQLSRMYSRYRFAAGYCHGKVVLEVAAGSGQGLGVIAETASWVVGSDYTESLLQKARKHYKDRIPLVRLDAHRLPFVSDSFDVVILYEAVYYLADPRQFLQECRRVLRSAGTVILCSANKEWSDFNPSPFSYQYYSARELAQFFRAEGFDVELAAACPVAAHSSRDKVVSLIKRGAVKLHLMPKTMGGKKLLKRLFLGRLTPLPPEIKEGMAEYSPPVSIPANSRCCQFKVLFAVAHLP